LYEASLSVAAGRSIRRLERQNGEKLTVSLRSVGKVKAVFSSSMEPVRSILTAGHLQVTLNKLLTYCVLRSTQPPTLSGTGNE